MYDLTNFTLSNMTSCGASLRGLGAEARGMEEVARRTVHYLHESFVNPHTGQKSFVLVRFFKTLSYERLEAPLKESIREILGREKPRADMKCLTLLATAGDKPEWNSRAQSLRHKAIPLSSVSMIERLPMISQLIKQFGFDLGMLLEPDREILVDLEQKTYKVFHVPEARSNPHVPDQEDFVVPCGVQSVLGFGGMLPTGNLFATIVFSRVSISRDTANMFKPLALSVKVAILPFVGGEIFL